MVGVSVAACGEPGAYRFATAGSNGGGAGVQNVSTNERRDQWCGSATQHPGAPGFTDHEPGPHHHQPANAQADSQGLHLWQGDRRGELLHRKCIIPLTRLNH